jgi:hypothetical protein
MPGGLHEGDPLRSCEARVLGGLWPHHFFGRVPGFGHGLYTLTAGREFDPALRNRPRHISGLQELWRSAATAARTFARRICISPSPKRSTGRSGHGPAHGAGANRR